MIYELNHFGLVVKDLEKSLAFYQRLMGAKIVYNGFIPSRKTNIVYLLIAGGMIELLHRGGTPEGENFGIVHIAFMSDSLDADYERMTGLGYKGLVAPRAAGSGAGRISFIEDPNGVRVELIQRDLKMREKPAKSGIVRSFDHYSIQADNLDSAVKFYRDAMGMKILKELTVPHPANPLSIVHLNWGYDVLELLHRPEPMPNAPLYGHYALRVDDVAKTLEFFAANGVQAEPGAPKRAGASHGNVGVIRDPDGVMIELVPCKV